MARHCHYNTLISAVKQWHAQQHAQQGITTSSMKCVSVAYATAVPSWVLVPLPSSSRITSDLAVADFMISEASWRQRRTKVSSMPSSNKEKSRHKGCLCMEL